MKNQLCLAADIGGTNTRIALFDSEVLLEDTCVTYSNNKYDSFESILVEYLDRVSISSVTHAGIAAAGPIDCLLYTSPSPRDVEESRMPSSA